MDVALTTEEAGALRDLLAGYLSDLHLEVATTGPGEYRSQLLRREMLLKRLLEQFREAAGESR